VISGHYILRDRWRNLRDRFGPSKHLEKNTGYGFFLVFEISNFRQMKLNSTQLLLNGTFVRRTTDLKKTANMYMK